MSNRVTLDGMLAMAVGDIATLPAEQLEMLQEDIKSLAGRAKLAQELLHAALDRRYAARAADLRKHAGKLSGSVRVAEDGIEVACDLPKKPKWDQAKLRDLRGKLRDMGEDPNEYITTELKVSEAAYNGWPSSLKALFESARTVGTGKPTYTLGKVAT